MRTWQVETPIHATITAYNSVSLVDFNGGMHMPDFGSWRTFEEKGKGGQGTVYLAHNRSKYDPDTIKEEIYQASVKLRSSAKEHQLQAAEALAQQILKFGMGKDASNCGALKLLHQPTDADELGRQLGRLQSEIKALQSLKHPNMIGILDHKLTDRWFVMEFFQNGTLAEHLDHYRGSILAVLTDFRLIVDAVAKMHARRMVHRDIKPENIFVSPDRKLVLGDLGLVLFMDEVHTRLTDTFENVGSWNWMPAWAMNKRVDEVKPSADVFSLGKVFWSMLSGQPKLTLWYIHEPEFELEKMFPNDRQILWAREILDHCVVEKERDCIPDAKELLKLIDEIMVAVGRHGQVVRKDIERVCLACGRGIYRRGGPTAWEPAYLPFVCDKCGHMEMYSAEKYPPART